MSIKQISLVFLLVFIISCLVIYPSFHIGLYGDDWLAIFRYIVHVAPPSKEGWNFFTYYLTPYGSQDIIMGLLYRNFGTNAFYYELTAYVFRMIAAFSFFPLVFYLTKNKLASFFAILFFSITTIGFDSTGWLLTMPTYLTIAFFNLFLYFYILFHENKKINLLLFSGILFYLAYVTASARMIGAPLFILSLEIFWIIRDHTKLALKHSALRLLFILFFLIIIGITGHSLGNSSDWFQRLTSGITTIQNLLGQGRFDFLFYPILTVGGMLVPNFTLPSIQIDTKKQMLTSIAIPALALFSILMLVIRSNTGKLSRNDLYKSLLAALIWLVIVFLIRKFNLISFSSSNLIMLLLVGGLAVIIWILLAARFYTQKRILTALFISFSWTFASFFFPWLWAPGSYFDTTHRYLTSSAVGIAIFLASLISLGKTFKNQLFLALLLSPLLLLHLTSTRTYISKLLDSHSQQITDKIWSQMPYIPEVGKKPLVFYFEKESSNGSVLGDAVLFGFPFHIALLYNLNERNTIPVSMTDWKEVVSAVTDGKSFAPYGYPLKPIPIDNIYGFRLEGKDNLINITDTVRRKLVGEK